ncbi:ArnT family glycosyltransferase [Streptomyces acidiscabies]|uniref:Membrane protein n=1 Tax=Streptomyces acidiscabies TaxID=42234 RepID=A0A0L0JR45_9ACTN|nr:glycosyltransferase family 39 protein [Streptomyces acidiscabies]KND28222.1 membrane protein [Streptomyces acidiscabies]
MTHTTEVPLGPSITRLPVIGRALPRRAAPVTLAAILLLSALLYGWALGPLGWGNSYYSAAVKSMGHSWTNFLFGSFDPAGVVTVDKPPAALWPQVVSSKIFGMHGWALILPQVLEGVAAVFVLHRTVRRWAGEGTALLAALVMALTPVTVAINRYNNPDTLLVLFLVSGAYALTRAVRSDSTRWLCASGFLVGCGFLTKMAAAWMVLPAFAAAWLVGASGPWLLRAGRLLAAGAVCAVSSLWWVAVVAWWPGRRPYIGGSADGGAWELVVGHNGLGRIFGESAGNTGGAGPSKAFGSEPGPLRLFSEQVAGQIGWLLPASAVALAVAAASAVLRRRGSGPAGKRLPGSGWVLWGTWLVVCGLMFSAQEGSFHVYYTTQLAPAVAALTAGLVTALVRAHRAGAWWALPVGAGTVLVTAAWAVAVIRRVPSWNGWLGWVVAVVGVVAVALLIAAALKPRLSVAAVGGAVLAALLAPGAWAVSVPAEAGSVVAGAPPSAGPVSFGVRMLGGGGPLPQGNKTPGGGSLPKGFVLPAGFGGTTLIADHRKILTYATAHSEGARITLAVDGGAVAASTFILNADATVIGMGGFVGGDDVPSVRQLAEWTGDGELRYVLGSSGGITALQGGEAGAGRSRWLTENCAEVPAKEYGGSGSAQSRMAGGAGTVLYDCAPARRPR